MAETYPSQPIKIITNMPVGSNPDTIIRRYSEILSRELKQPVIVDNRPGASGAVALDHFNQNNDAHTIYIGDAVSITGMPYLYNREHLLTNINPLFLMYRNSWVVVASSKYKTTQDAFVDFKKNPYFGSWAVGSVGQICGHELSMVLTNNRGIHVPYKEYSAWFLDLISQTVKLSCTSFGSSLPYVQDRRLQYIAVVGNTRSPLHPNVPSLKELTNQDISVPDGWVGVFVHKDLKPSMIKKLESAFVSASKNKDIIKTLEISSLDPNTSLTSKDFSVFIKKSTDDYKKAIKRFNITVN